MKSSENGETWEGGGTDVGNRSNPIVRVREWFLVDGDRLLVALGLTGVAFVSLVALDRVGAVAFVNDDSMTRFASGMIAGTFSLVTLVVSINQLILSREFTAAGEAREQLGGVLTFREDVADAATVPAAPATPTKLLELLVETIHRRADALAESVADHDEDVRERIVRYAESVEASTGAVDETIERTTSGTFQALSAAVRYDDARQLYVGRQLRRRNADALSSDADEAFDELLGALELFGIAREHFKTTYLQRELTRFSQLTIYTGVPAILAAMLVALLYADLRGPTISVASLPIVVSALVAVVLSPLALLTSFILRTATVTRRTASTGPMLPGKDPEAGPFEVSPGEEE